AFGPQAQGLIVMAGLIEGLLQDPHLIIVAAAGNDSDRTQTPPLVFPPRFPAMFNGVIGAAATSATGMISSFSNRADLDDNQEGGLAAFGGERPQNGSLGAYVPSEGPAGLTIVAHLRASPPGGPVNNPPGGAKWAGPSFAAPTVPGIIAPLGEAMSGNPAS